MDLPRAILSLIFKELGPVLVVGKENTPPTPPKDAFPFRGSHSWILEVIGCGNKRTYAIVKQMIRRITDPVLIVFVPEAQGGGKLGHAS